MPARREGSRGARSSGSDFLDSRSRAVPGSNQSDEVGNSGAWVRRGISVPNERFLAAPWVALAPGVPPFGGVAPRYGQRSSLMVRASVGSPRATGSVFPGSAGWSASPGPARARVDAVAGTNRAPPRAAVGGSGRPTGPGRCRRHRSENSERGSCPGGRRRRALVAEREPCNGHGPRHCGPRRERGR